MAKEGSIKIGGLIISVWESGAVTIRGYDADEDYFAVSIEPTEAALFAGFLVGSLYEGSPSPFMKVEVPDVPV